jgi:hypothetical protein
VIPSDELTNELIDLARSGDIDSAERLLFYFSGAIKGGIEPNPKLLTYLVEGIDRKLSDATEPKSKRITLDAALGLKNPANRPTSSKRLEKARDMSICSAMYDHMYCIKHQRKQPHPSGETITVTEIEFFAEPMMSMTAASKKLAKLKFIDPAGGKPRSYDEKTIRDIWNEHSHLFI